MQAEREVWFWCIPPCRANGYRPPPCDPCSPLLPPVSDPPPLGEDGSEGNLGQFARFAGCGSRFLLPAPILYECDDVAFLAETVPFALGRMEDARTTVKFVVGLSRRQCPTEIHGQIAQDGTLGLNGLRPRCFAQGKEGFHFGHTFVVPSDEEFDGFARLEYLQCTDYFEQSLVMLFDLPAHFEVVRYGACPLFIVAEVEYPVESLVGFVHLIYPSGDSQFRYIRFVLIASEFFGEFVHQLGLVAVALLVEPFVCTHQDAESLGSFAPVGFGAESFAPDTTCQVAESFVADGIECSHFG
ncbi:hypothetical protein HQ46_03640 [Porphyromonas gulae]|nr:hypothetical protein HQ46_03640 [Porphyromonas gulae]